MTKLLIKQPDDWHSHLRENSMLEAVLSHSSDIFKRSVAMPNLKNPIINWQMAKKYRELIKSKISSSAFEALVPCYLTDNLDLNNFSNGLKNKHFFGAKLYPVNTTTNSSYGVSNIEKIYPALEVLEKGNYPLLVHGEKNHSSIDIFDREKYFIDDELKKIIKRFQNLKIVLEHVSSSYGADFIAESSDLIAATVTVHHLLLTRKDVFNGSINPHHYCMPIAKDEKDLISLRKYVCSGNKKFFLGTDSAPHDIQDKKNINEIKPGIFSTPVAVPMYTSIFEEEGYLKNLEKFTSINGPNFYGLTSNQDKVVLSKEEWVNPEYTTYKNIKIKNFMAGKLIKWKINKHTI